MASGINIRMDPQLKEEFDAFCSDIGLTMTAAFVLFAKKCVSSHRIPFAIGDGLPMQGRAAWHGGYCEVVRTRALAPLVLPPLIGSSSISSEHLVRALPEADLSDPVVADLDRHDIPEKSSWRWVYGRQDDAGGGVQRSGRIWACILVRCGRRDCNVYRRDNPLHERDTIRRGRQKTCSGKEKRPHADRYENELAVSRQGTGGHDDKPGIYRQLRIHGRWEAPHQAGHVHQCEAAAHDHAVLSQLPDQGLL